VASANEAEAEDIPSWLEIVREVEPLFGPMPDFEATLARKIRQRAALCVRSSDADSRTRVLGGVLLGGRPDHGWIRWLAVRTSARGGGIGHCLVDAALKRFDAASVVSLDTFREEVVEGRPARRLYERMGFEPGLLIELEGTPRQRYVLRRGTDQPRLRRQDK
jgi:ribosomal protein S18 acetylase RimI-like enzyme